ncbi:MAG: bifunctional phosphoribosylaminoimidazolecarboxamide formyltransferase/IMP cyclohydrolase [Candidatus Eremiobacteraeota bacterium]|nr:bifunctional phosphoribosylaminoimidazolecarboxamide formyltransferase/IMP cyclohydrolase [Candidatus Eremiobacteraeota bacterium]
MRGGSPRLPKGALFSLSDKTGSAAVAQALVERGYTLYATGGTRTFLAGHNIEAREVEDLTGFPALFDGRVKTLHPKVFGAILRDRDNAAHSDQAEQYHIADLSVLVVNLYPFESTIANHAATLHEAIEQIDIGGVSLLRAAAKNFHDVTILSDPSQYDAFLRALPAGGVDEPARRRLAVAAFARTAEYDAAIAHYLAGSGDALPSALPGALTLTLPLAQRLRYGTNPQLRAAFYLANPERLPEQLHGKALSYNNLLDLDAALRLLSRAPLGAPIGSQHERFMRAAIVKHTVPCGVAQRSSVGKAVRDALDADPVSAFGGIIALDAPVDLEAAQALSAFFLEIVAAPEFSPDALALLQKKKNLRIMRYALGAPEELQRELRVRSALGGVLAEEEDPTFARETWRVVSEREPLPQEWHDLAFAWDIVRHVKSNGVVIVKDGATRGICAGQTNRVSAVKIAGVRAGEKARGAACASDGFFPFADGLEEAAAAGCTAIIAPDGSIRDADVIAAANQAGISLVFSSHRYFLH